MRALLGYDPAETGGLMSPDSVCLHRQATVAEARERVRTSRLSDELLTTVFVMDSDRRLQGGKSLGALLRARPAQGFGELVRSSIPYLTADAGLEAIARLMADYDLISAPVIDEPRADDWRDHGR